MLENKKAIENPIEVCTYSDSSHFAAIVTSGELMWMPQITT